MEGVAAEAASLAGHLRLGNLIYLYLDNYITIEGETQLAFSEEVATRFLAYGWHVERVEGDNLRDIEPALERAKNDPRPSLIIARTHIAEGSPNKRGTAEAHGAPLGAAEVRLIKVALGRDPESLSPFRMRCAGIWARRWRAAGTGNRLAEAFRSSRRRPRFAAYSLAADDHRAARWLGRGAARL